MQAKKTPPDSLSLPIVCLIPGEYTHGAGRYITDTLARWLIPGKNTVIIGQVSLNFRFTAYPSLTFFILQNIACALNLNDLEIMQNNLPRWMTELRINIMAVYRARYLTALRSSPIQYKNLIIEENISSILSRKEDPERNLYDHIQQVFVQSNPEERMNEIKKNISFLLTARPKTFDRDVFYEIVHHAALFKNIFSSKSPRHLSRIIAYHYLFKKTLVQKIQHAPQTRHCSLKILRGDLHEQEPRVALLLGFNFLKDTERFDIKHLMEALKSCLPHVQCPADSLIVDRRHEKIRFFYFELAKGGLPFTREEFQQIKAQFPQEIERQIEHVVHPVFMPRNDEELLRNLIVLSNQLKYARDIPQVTIHYDTQVESELTFIVILVRLLRKTSPSLSQLVQEAPSVIKISIDDVRIAGYLKNKYPKEASILRVCVNKNPFFRTDHSVDVLRARQKIACELKNLFGEFRYFNGGMILKQDEALEQLRHHMEPLTKEQELLLENYFYSLRPGIMQTVSESTTLKIHFELLLKAIDAPFSPLTHQIFSLSIPQYFLCIVKAISPSFKDMLLDTIASLRIPSHDLVTTFLQIGPMGLMGSILRVHDGKEMAITRFLQAIEHVMNTWNQENMD